MTAGGHRVLFAALVLLASATCWPASPVVAAAPFEVDAVKSARTLPGTLEVVGVVAKRNAAKEGKFLFAESVEAAGR